MMSYTYFWPWATQMCTRNTFEYRTFIFSNSFLYEHYLFSKVLGAKDRPWAIWSDQSRKYIWFCGLGSRIRDMEAKSHNWSYCLVNLWQAELALWDELKVELKCQSVRWYMMFMASNSLHNMGGQKLSCPCYHARHLQQIHWTKLFCGMYGFTAKLSVATCDYRVSY